MRAFSGAAFAGCESHLQGVGTSEGDGLGEGLVVRNTVNSVDVSQFHQVEPRSIVVKQVTHFSFNPEPTPAPLV